MDFALAQYNRSGCPPVPSFPVQGRPHCVEDNDLAFSALTEAHPDIVLLDSAWSYGNITPRLMELIAKLHEQKIPRIIIMGPLPYWDLGLPKAVLDYYRSNLHQIIPKRSSFRVDLTEFQFQQRFRDKIRELGLEYISTWDALCKGRECLTRTGDTAADLMSFDTMHLTLSGSELCSAGDCTLFISRSGYQGSPAVCGCGGAISVLSVVKLIPPQRV